MPIAICLDLSLNVETKAWGKLKLKIVTYLEEALDQRHDTISFCWIVERFSMQSTLAVWLSQRVFFMMPFSRRSKLQVGWLIFSTAK